MKQRERPLKWILLTYWVSIVGSLRRWRCYCGARALRSPNPPSWPPPPPKPKLIPERLMCQAEDVGLLCAVHTGPATSRTRPTGTGQTMIIGRSWTHFAALASGGALARGAPLPPGPEACGSRQQRWLGLRSYHITSLCPLTRQGPLVASLILGWVAPVPGPLAAQRDAG